MKYYDTIFWEKEGEIKVSHNAIGIAVDEVSQAVYTGCWDVGRANEYLSRYDLLADPNTTNPFPAKIIVTAN